MRVGVIGAGNIGGTLGRAWARAGHDVVFGVRDPEGPKTTALLDGAPGARTAGVAEAARDADVVLIAVPGSVLDAVLADLWPHIEGSVVIDASNNMAGGPMNGTTSIKAAAAQASVFRAFNSLGWENFADPIFRGVPADLFYCGPEGRADEQVAALINDVGLRPVRVGDLDQVDVVDSVTRLWFSLSRTRGRHLAFKVLED